MLVTVIPVEAYHLYEPVLPDDLAGTGGLMIGAFEGNSLEGILYASPVSSAIWRIEHLLVVSDVRRQGIGSELVDECKRNLSMYGVHTLLAEHLASESPEAMDLFLLDRGFIITSETTVMQTALGALADCADRFPGSRWNDDIHPLSEMPDDVWARLTDHFATARHEQSAGDTVTELYPRDIYHPTLSRYVADIYGNITDILLIRAYDDALSVDYIWCEGRLGGAMLKLISTAIDDAGGSYPPETDVSFHAMNPMTVRIAAKLASGGIENIGVMRKYCFWIDRD